MTSPNPISIVNQPVGNAQNNQFNFGFGYNAATQSYVQTMISLNSSFTAIDPATDESVQQCVVALEAIQASTAIISLNSGACTITQSIVPLPQNGTYTIPANANRKSLQWMVTGQGAICVCPGTAAPTTNLGGIVYDGCSIPPGASNASGYQGGSQEYDGPSVPTNAFSILAFDQETNIIIWEGA